MQNIYSNKLFLTAFSIIVVIVLMSNSSGRANSSGQAVTGAPGDSNNTCASSGCHASGAFSPNAVLSVTDDDGNSVSSFAPGETYEVTLTVESSGSPSAFGFQMVALKEDNSAASDWSDIGSNVQSVSIGSRNYIEHKSPSSSNEFKTKWTAPGSGSGDVTFYFAANAVNGNGGNTGDGGTNSTFVLPELVTSSSELTFKSISVFPQPAGDFVTISGEQSEYEYTLFDLNGQKLQASNFSQSTTVDISQMNQGLYFLIIQNDDKIITKKIFKK